MASGVRMLLFFVLLLKGQTFPFNYMHDLLGRQNGKISLNRFLFLLFNLAQGCHERLGNVTALIMLLRRILVPYHSFAPFLIIALAVFFWEGVIQRGDGANEAPNERASRVIRGHSSPENFKNKVL